VVTHLDVLSPVVKDRVLFLLVLVGYQAHLKDRVLVKLNFVHGEQLSDEPPEPDGLTCHLETAIYSA
jgi:hypothetical protein